jgi:hypothetical protein
MTVTQNGGEDWNLSHSQQIPRENSPDTTEQPLDLVVPSGVQLFALESASHQV